MPQKKLCAAAGAPVTPVLSGVEMRGSLACAASCVAPDSVRNSFSRD